MIRVPATGGAAAFSRLLDSIPRTLFPEVFGVTERTMRRWLSGQSDIPRTAWVSAYIHSRYGDDLIEYQFGYEVHTLRALVRCYQRAERPARLLPAANEPQAGSLPPGLQVISLVDARA